MEKFLYLSLAPEALIASNLPPEQFGAYYATGDYHRSFDQAIFFEINPDFKSDYFPMGKFDELCVPHSDGTPHKSVYLSVYRVLEHVPISAFRNLYLTTADGRTLELKKADFVPDSDKPLDKPRKAREHGKNRVLRFKFGRARKRSRKRRRPESAI